jgi:hypothetical protein
MQSKSLLLKSALIGGVCALLQSGAVLAAPGKDTTMVAVADIQQLNETIDKNDVDDLAKNDVNQKAEHDVDDLAKNDTDDGAKDDVHADVNEGAHDAAEAKQETGESENGDGPHG